MLFDEIFLPPRLQALTGLDNVLRKPISLGCKELFCATEHSFAFGRHRRTGQGIKGVAVEGRKRRGRDCGKGAKCSSATTAKA